MRSWRSTAPPKEAQVAQDIRGRRPHVPDGFRVNVDGDIWASAADDVHCIAPDGEMIGKILVPETVTHIAFGGPKRNRLFITAAASLYSVYVGLRAL